MSQVDDAHIAPQTLIIFFGFLVFTAVFGSLLCGLWYSQLAMQQVLKEGFETVALLEEKSVDESRRFWFTYRFETITDATYLSTIEVTEEEYHDHELGSFLMMRYNVKNPEFNALDFLEDDIEAEYRVTMQLSGLVLVIASVLGFGWIRTIPLVRIQAMWKRG